MTIEQRIECLIKNGTSLSKLEEKTGLNLKEISYYLEKYNAQPKQFKDRIRWKSQNIIAETEMEKDSILEIHMEKNHLYRSIFFADTHIGSKYESINSLFKLYEFGKQNDIHAYYLLGDAIEGVYVGLDCWTGKFDYIEEYLDHFVKNFPKEEKTVTNILYGNHDYNSLKVEGIDISQRIFQERPDLCNLGYQQKTLKIEDFYIHLEHPFHFRSPNTYNKKVYQYYQDKNYMPFLVIRGHMHDSLFSNTAYGFDCLELPCFYQHNGRIPSAYIVTIEFNHYGDVKTLILEQLIVLDKVYSINEIKKSFPEDSLRRKKIKTN